MKAVSVMGTWPNRDRYWRQPGFRRFVMDMQRHASAMSMLTSSNLTLTIHPNFFTSSRVIGRPLRGTRKTGNPGAFEI